MIKDYIKDKKEIIYKKLQEILENQKKEFKDINFLAEDFLNKLSAFSLNGKCIRGSMIMLSAEMYGLKNSNEVITLAAAYELIHTALLIEDDIIDNDDLRRGSPTVFHQYELDGIQAKLDNPRFYGQGMGIVTGLNAVFIANSIMQSIDINERIKNKIILFINSEFVKVGIGEMLDSYIGFNSIPPDIEDIKIMYKYKTGRYSFSVPFTVGCLCADSVDETSKLDELGEFIGLIFQYKDDEIGICTDVEELGKPVGSDIRQDKKTLIRNKLFAKADSNDLIYLNLVFGKKDINSSDIAKIRQLLSKYEIIKDLHEEINVMALKSKKLIEDLHIEKKHKELLNSLVEYNLLRTF